MRLVEKGVLKNYLLTRQPVRGYRRLERPRAAARQLTARPRPASAICSCSASETVPVAELKKKLIELCQARSKPYGIIVRKMDFPSSASVDEARRLLQGSQGGRPVSHSAAGLQAVSRRP